MMNDLVKRLTKRQGVEFSRPKKDPQTLKECIDRNYVHVLFTNTGTEIGVHLDKKSCNFDGCDFENGRGIVVLSGVLTLNFDQVKCVSEIDLATCEGIGWLEPIDDEEYSLVISEHDV